MATVVRARHANARLKWTCRYMVDGKTKEESFRTQREADDRKIEVEHGQRTNTFADPKSGRVSFNDYAAGWIAGLDRATGTKANYLSALNARIVPAFKGKTLVQVASDREATWSLITGMDGSASRKKAVLSIIMGACDEAVRAGKIGSHRLGGLSVRKDAQEPAEIIPATAGQLEKLADGLKPELELTVWLMRGCGLRISEALAVKLGGFRDNGRVLRICEQVNRDGGLGPLKARKRGECRDVPVPSWLWAKVQAHVKQYGTDDGYLFGKGKRVTYSSYVQRFMTSAKNAGLGESFTPHQLRHLYVSTLLSANVPITDVATWVGHRDINVTHAVYGHLLPDSWTRGRQALDALAL